MTREEFNKWVNKILKTSTGKMILIIFGIILIGYIVHIAKNNDAGSSNTPDKIKYETGIPNTVYAIHEIIDDEGSYYVRLLECTDYDGNYILTTQIYMEDVLNNIWGQTSLGGKWVDYIETNVTKGYIGKIDGIHTYLYNRITLDNKYVYVFNNRLNLNDPVVDNISVYKFYIDSLDTYDKKAHINEPPHKDAIDREFLAKHSVKHNRKFNFKDNISHHPVKTNIVFYNNVFPNITRSVECYKWNITLSNGNSIVLICPDENDILNGLFILHEDTHQIRLNYYISYYDDKTKYTNKLAYRRKFHAYKTH